MNDNEMLHHRRDCLPDIPTDEKVKFLQQPENYPDFPAKIESVQTHMSWVFLGDPFAYKLKKPCTYDYEMLGAARVGECMLNVYSTIASDRADLGLISFYKCIYAIVRAKLALWHLADVANVDQLKWQHRAQDYLRMAEQSVGLL